MNKRIVALVTCIVLIGLLFAAGCKTIKSRTGGELAWIHFDWEKATIGDRYLEKAAMLVPVTIDNLPQKFNMQFDLGATISEFYGTTIAPFLERYPDLAKKLNTPDNQRRPRFSSINLGLGSVVLNNLTIFNRENYGDTLAIDTIDLDEEIHIGTIGPDIVQDKILIIDFPGQRFAITEQIPEEYQALPVENFEMRPGLRFFLPFIIDGKEEFVLFDTGNSSFAMVTSREHALSISGSDIMDSITLPSWGKEYFIYGHEIVKDVYFGGKNLKGEMVYYDSSGSMDDYFSGDMWGSTGNAMFFENIVIFDCKNMTVRIK